MKALRRLSAGKAEAAAAIEASKADEEPPPAAAAPEAEAPAEEKKPSKEAPPADAGAEGGGDAAPAPEEKKPSKEAPPADAAAPPAEAGGEAETNGNHKAEPEAAAAAPAAAAAAPPAEPPKAEGQPLAITIVKANHLQHLNFTGDNIYVVCELSPKDESRKTDQKIQTKDVKGLDPEYEGEDHSLEGWTAGDDIVFTVYDRGMLNSKVEGTVTLTSDKFFPTGFDGELDIGDKGAKLTVKIAPPKVAVDSSPQPACQCVIC